MISVGATILMMLKIENKIKRSMRSFQVSPKFEYIFNFRLILFKFVKYYLSTFHLMKLLFWF